MNQLKGKYPFQYQIAKSLELISNDCLSIQERHKRLPLIKMNKNRPLLILLTWVNSNPSHAYKFVDVYLERGFDVLVVSSSTWEMLWPVRGIFVNGQHLADFLNEHQHYEPLVVHGLSVGCTVWSHTEGMMLINQNKYQKTIDRLAGCIWDSPPVGETANMLSFLVFNKDSVFRLIGEQLIKMSLLLTYFIFHQHNKRVIHGFLNSGLELPKLILFSKDDPISPYKKNLEACEVWKSKGIKMNYKLWEKSVHVSHFHFHRKEYLKQIDVFLESIGLASMSN